jgi:hypothetical protein
MIPSLLCGIMAKCKGLHESWSKLASARDDDWFVVIQGNYAKVTRKLHDPPQRKHTPKTAISGFTYAARLRLLKWIAKVEWSSVGESRFITLTYPDSHVETTYKDRAVQRFLFLRHIENRIRKSFPCLWRTEWIVRKSGAHEGYLMPHHHLLAMDVGFIPNDVVREWWKGILRVDEHVSTDVKKAPADASASYYVAKYAAKLLHLDIAPYLNNMLMTGRQWGVTRRPLVPMCELTASRCLTEGEIELAKQLGRTIFSRYGEFGEGGFTVLGKDKVDAIKELFGTALAE